MEKLRFVERLYKEIAGTKPEYSISPTTTNGLFIGCMRKKAADAFCSTEAPQTYLLTTLTKNYNDARQSYYFNNLEIDAYQFPCEMSEIPKRPIEDTDCTSRAHVRFDARLMTRIPPKNKIGSIKNMVSALSQAKSFIEDDLATYVRLVKYNVIHSETKLALGAIPFKITYHKDITALGDEVPVAPKLTVAAYLPQSAGISERPDLEIDSDPDKTRSMIPVVNIQLRRLEDALAKLR